MAATKRVIVFIQENKTTDFYFPTMAAWGAAVANNGKLLTAAPNFDQPHDRNAWVHYAMGDYPAEVAQLDNDLLIPFYSWLAKQFVFADHHFGPGSNSTPGHMLAVGGQMPTLKNPPFVGPHPVWNLPSIFSVAEAAGVSWGAFPDQSGYPVKFYTTADAGAGQRQRAPADPVHPDGQGRHAAAGLLRLVARRATTSIRPPSAHPTTSRRDTIWSGSACRR